MTPDSSGGAPSAAWEEGHRSIGRGAIHYRFRAGSGNTPLVFLHEGLGSIGSWRGVPGDIADRFPTAPTLVYSRHGYGRSATVTEPRTVDYMHREGREVLPALLDSFALSKPILVGHSDGASIALLFASAGFTVSGVVVIAPHVFVEECTIESIEGARVAFTSTGLAEALARHHDDAHATFFGWNDVWLSDEFRDWDITSELHRITAPTLLIQGTDDPYGSAAQLDAIVARLSGSHETLLIPGIGHSPHLEAPEVTLDAMSAFISRIVHER